MSRTSAFGLPLLLATTLAACGSPAPAQPADVPVAGADFDKTGVIVRNNPGLPPNTWYVIYQEAGKPGLNKALAFDGKSRCISTQREETACDPATLSSGQHVALQGALSGSVLRVLQLTMMP
jgi:hypothetical protein